jgi:putative ABC transport system substrate-binding protein
MNKIFRIRFFDSCSDNRKSKIQNRKLVGIVAIGVAFALCGAVARAQQPGKVPLVGILSSGSPGPTGTYSLTLEAFRQGLRELAYVEGKNILLEYRYAEGRLDRMRSLVSELVQLKPAVIVVANVPAIRAAKQATKTIPIVIISSIDPVAEGIVDSLARPGGNITGLSVLTRELSGKRLELLAEVLEKKSRVAVLWDLDGPGPKIAFEEYKAVAPLMKLQLQSLGVRAPTPDFEAAFQAATKGRAQALIIILNPLLGRYQKQIIALAIKNRLPSMCEEGQYVEAGCLMSYAANSADRWRRAATYVDKILKGRTPDDLPVEQPMKFEFIVNLNTAKQIGFTVPPNVLVRADRVIR